MWIYIHSSCWVYMPTLKYNFCLCHFCQDYEESPLLHCGTSTPRGVIYPHSSEEIPLFLCAKAVGKLHHTLRIAVFGSTRPSLVSLCVYFCVDICAVTILCTCRFLCLEYKHNKGFFSKLVRVCFLICLCSVLFVLFCSVLFKEVVLSCTGQGPVVYVESPRLDFGRIPVLTDCTKTLHLSNQSPVPAHFTAGMVQTHCNQACTY